MLRTRLTDALQIEHPVMLAGISMFQPSAARSFPLHANFLCHWTSSTWFR